MKDKILHLIAMSFPYSLEEIKAAHDSLKSIDATILLCETAAYQGHTTLWTLIPSSQAQIVKSKEE